MSTNILKPAADSSVLKSVAAAKRQGYRFPLPEHYGGEEIIVKGETLVRNPYIAKSRTALLKMGYTIIDHEEPHDTVSRSVAGHYGSVDFDVFRHDQVERRVINKITGSIVSIQPEPVLDPRRQVMAQA